MKASKILLFAFIIALTSCNKPFNNDYDFTYETIVTEIPVNLENINTIYDDYNSDLPYPAARGDIYFSTNRNSSGKNFDIIYKSMDISYHQKDDVLNLSYVSDDNGYTKYSSKVLETINTSFDEYGPFYHFGNEAYEYFFYANNESGNFDIKFASSKKADFGTYMAQEIVNAPVAFQSINSDADDYYPCIYNENQTLVFCSNREAEVFSIYETAFNEKEINPDYLMATDHEIVRNSILSSDSNDKCPFVFDNIMVFTSDRPGGYGGFDLYYAELVDGKWTQPQNLGEQINSAYDEYRPVIVPFFELDETMLIFSSNRPGGKGGFDLYATRTKAVPKPDYYY